MTISSSSTLLSLYSFFLALGFKGFPVGAAKDVEASKAWDEAGDTSLPVVAGGERNLDRDLGES